MANKNADQSKGKPLKSPETIEEDNVRMHPNTSEYTLSSQIFDSRRQSCDLCTNNDDIDMVRCDNEDCKKWFHFACVNVTREQVELNIWFCFNCKEKLTRTSSTPKTPDTVTPKGSIRSSHSSRSRKDQSSIARLQQLALERLEEERRLREVRDREYLDQKAQEIHHQANAMGQPGMTGRVGQEQSLDISSARQHHIDENRSDTFNGLRERYANIIGQDLDRIPNIRPFIQEDAQQKVYSIAGNV
ncbi:Chromatin modification-related protein YNG2 [Pseudolycoriella hygida]|uniref:Chromatin modification-related protein YNG2 n=1 Tax=Pseudolycoriella hygida TaxID=35572 RepID=A0A9Q0NFR4_9DIPT|nr:Chromatin modification-related protein YNG2 [Pseudolycoriella hygida]